MNFDTSFLVTLQNALTTTSSPALEKLPSGAKAFLIAELLKSSKQTILYLSADHTPMIIKDLEFFNVQALQLPESSELDSSADVRGIEYQTLHTLKHDPHQVVVGSLQSLIRLFADPHSLKDELLEFKTSHTYPFKELFSTFSSMGYTQQPLVSAKGTFALRGGIIDIFPFEASYPYRLEFDDQELISLREFDPFLQTSIKKVASFSIRSCPNSQATHSLFDYLSNHPLIIFDGLEDLEEQWVFSQRLKHETLNIKTDRVLFFAEKRLNLLFSQQHDSQHFLNLGLSIQPLSHPFLAAEEFFITSSSVNFDELALQSPSFIEEGGIVELVYATESEKNLILEKKIKATLTPGFLSKGFYTLAPPRLLLSFQDFHHKNYVYRSPIKMISSETSKEYDFFHTGDIVVHATQGIGKCLGVEKKNNHLGQEMEYFKLEFAQKSILYVPIKEAHLITRYVGSSVSLPTFSQLGSSKWQKIRAQTQASLIGYAQKLLDLAALRKQPKPYTYPKDSPVYKQFEDEFPFVATVDQLKAIEAIKEDMRQGTPMDRLICGDVGYGKTEVAMRAAAKAILDGHKQVAVLVPTTVLAMQHFENFKDRMANFPIQLGILSRFNTSKEIKNTLDQLKKGSLDLVIGTHRLLSSDVVFADLGLMIVDEEQRFGVKAKESLKQIKATVDCLTLSATPIPRTLYTSIVNLRQMSLISTPPYDRVPIKTVLSTSDDAFIKHALLKEIARKGQSYFIHNRVENLPLIHKKLVEMIPEAKIAQVHGQMEAEAIDTIFHSFKTGHIDILIATTLVENGVDIPNANTILIDNAHHFGLSDLYQLRGRVGRWNKAATCYLLIPKNQILEPQAKKRLEAIVSTSGYGGGLKVALRDLELRGAGDLLGVEQSGHVSQVGFTLYCKLLKKTVHALEHQQPLTLIEPKIECYAEAKIPQTYIEAVDIRIEFYHKFGDADSQQELDEIFKELIDRFGQPPVAATWLYVITKIKLFCIKHYILTLNIQKTVTTFEKSYKGKITQHSLALTVTQPLLFFTQLVETLEHKF
jgi:transcription-repair coupling factor (superfamily II helicase)